MNIESSFNNSIDLPEMVSNVDHFEIRARSLRNLKRIPKIQYVTKIFDIKEKMVGVCCIWFIKYQHFSNFPHYWKWQKCVRFEIRIIFCERFCSTVQFINVCSLKWSSFSKLHAFLKTCNDCELSRFRKKVICESM